MQGCPSDGSAGEAATTRPVGVGIGAGGLGHAGEEWASTDRTRAWWA